MTNKSILEDELAVNIDKTRKQVTILFTDIVDSSRYWDQFGDVKGRMMVDMHNRLVFPIIKKFKGRVIKTIGDGLMAAFKKPHNALNAAIGIQQILKKMRDVDRTFHAKVRIGVHTGMAIVENKDVFGDVVNVASRVESFGEANEIVLSSATADLINEKKHSFHKKGSFIPKGKREPMTVYRCRWNEYKDFSRGLKVSSDFPLDAREKGDIVAYLIVLLAVIITLYHNYLRYIIASNIDLPTKTKLLVLNPLLIFTEYNFAFPALIVLSLCIVLLLMWIKNAPYILFRTLKGVMGFFLGYFIIYAPTHYFEIDIATKKNQEVFMTDSRFVLADSAISDKVAKLYRIDERNLYTFFRQDMIIPVSKKNPLSNKIKKLLVPYRNIEKNNNQSGVWAEKKLSKYKVLPFYFRLMDLCAVCLGVLGFVYGFLNFTIRPS